MTARQVYLVLAVDLDADGKPTGARIDLEGGPWAYSDWVGALGARHRPQTWHLDADDWRPSTDDEEWAAYEYAGKLLGAKP